MRRTLIAVAALFALLHLAGSSDLLSHATRPVVVSALQAFGVAAQDTEGELLLGKLRVPWTRDCAGLNILTVLWAVTLWANRTEPLSRVFWLRLLLALPAALFANLCRIFTLIGYRHFFFPAVETPQLHYFIGFLWVMPCLVFFVPRGQRKLGTYLLETLFVVVALALVSPFVSAPGGSVVTLATLLLLAQNQHTLRFGSRGLAAASLWAIAGLFIGLASMESVWLPWLMLCPWFAPPGFYRSPAKLLLLPGTIPLVAMHPVARWVILGAAGFEVWSLLRPRPSPSCKAPGVPRPAVASESLARSALALLLVFPFLASSLSGWMRSPLLPPLGVMSQRVAANAFKLRLLGQARDIELMLYTPSGDGRHHTLPVCMRYRGIRLQPVRDEPSVMTDGKRWMKEFFLQGGQLVSDYRAYLRRTMWPWSSAGVHVIASMPTNAMGAAAFAQNVDRLARDLHALGSPIPKLAESSSALTRDPRPEE